MNTTIEKAKPTKTSRSCSELIFRDQWDTQALRRLVQRKTEAGKKPAYLFLGHREANLLREHIGTAFGPESVRSLKNHYYMGMEVIELETTSYMRTAGKKRVSSLTEALDRKPGWRDLEASSFWFFSVR